MTRFERLAEAALERAAPEARWYVLDARGLPAAWRSKALLGWTVSGLAAIAEPVLRDRGRWRGPGLAIVVHPGRVGAYAAIETGLQGGKLRREVRARLRSLVCHEAAHCFDGAGIAAPSDLAAARTALAARIVASDSRVSAAPEPTTCPHHGPRWVRAVLHLRYRLERIGFDLEGVDPIEPAMYDLPVGFKMESSLYAEIRDLARLPIAEILNRKPPKRFAELFD